MFSFVPLHQIRYPNCLQMDFAYWCLNSNTIITSARPAVWSNVSRAILLTRKRRVVKYIT